MNKATVKDLNITDKKVIIRVDFNVPLDDELNITDDRRIQAALPTIQYILAQKPSKLIIMSHLGRPKGEIVASMSLKPTAERLQKHAEGHPGSYYSCQPASAPRALCPQRIVVAALYLDQNLPVKDKPKVLGRR